MVIEIDTKAALDKIEDSFGYYYQKTKELLAFGVERVVWIYTDLQSVLIAEKDKDWKILDWNKSFQLVEDPEINISDIIDSMQEG